MVERSDATGARPQKKGRPLNKSFWRSAPELAPKPFPAISLIWAYPRHLRLKSLLQDPRAGNSPCFETRRGHFETRRGHFET